MTAANVLHLLSSNDHDSPFRVSRKERDSDRSLALFYAQFSTYPLEAELVLLG